MAGFQFQRNRVLNGVESEGNVTTHPVTADPLEATDLMFLRVTNQGLVNVVGPPAQVRRRFKAEFSADGTTWYPADGLLSDSSTNGNTNINLVSGIVQVGVAGGALGTLAGAVVDYDWVEIEVIPEPASLALGLLACCGIAGLGLRRRQK
jgi:hypothetical protein